MNDKTREQIEAMKNQTIGVEIEMNNITREKAARKVAEYFGTRAWNAASEYGYYSWACKDGQGRVWKFQRDVSIYGPDAEKCELVTPILTYDDIETLQEIIRLLRKAGAKSGPSRGCGVHIHIGKGDHTAKTIRNLVNIMAAHEQQIGRAIRIDAGRTGQYCQVVNHRFLDRLNREKPTTMRKLEDIWYEGNGSSWENRNAHYNSSRYHMLNLHATFTKGTIEFRLFQFADPADGKRNGLHAGEMKAYIQLCLAMSQLAKMVRTASPKPQQTDNEKYAMRCWMLRLGFIGDEFIEKVIEELGKTYHILEIAFDRWGAVQMTQNLEGMGFTVIPFGQGFKDMSPPTKEFYKLLMEGGIIHGGNPVMAWMAGNVVVDTDPAGNIKPTKAKSPEKIDGIVAAIMALDRCIRNEGQQQGSVYDERDMIVF